MPPSFDWHTWIRQSLPQEHGSWAFVLEPLLIATVLDPGKFGLIAIGTFLLFLGFRPFQIGMKDLLKRKRYPRTLPSTIAGCSLGFVGLSCLVLSANWLATSWILGMGVLFLTVSKFTQPRALVRETVGALLAVPVAVLAAPYAAEVLVIRPIVSILGVRGFLARWPDHVMSRWLAVAGGFTMLLFALTAFPLDNSKFVAYLMCAIRALELALTPKFKRTPSTLGAVEAILAVAVIVSWSAQGF
ncbi:MAG: YwiC-like family protein [Armatimonadetes bacterium]|nr:YwiC-like family protein [Armatimonadota bacterium]